MSKTNSRLQNRAGAVLIVAALSMMTLIIMLAFTIDISRRYVQRNELQTGADAAALAGAVQMLTDSATVPSTAATFAGLNKVLNATVALPVANVTCGVWDPNTATFSTPSGSSTCGGAANAVRVTRTDAAHHLFGGVLGAPATQMTTSAVAWASSTVTASSCIRPWAIPYSLLLQRINPGTTDTTRDLTEDDLAKLTSLPASSLSFKLKVGSPPTMPGNFGAVDISGPGANNYRNDIETCSDVVIGPGTVLSTEPGNMVGPTVQGAGELCQPLYANGACGNGSGGIGVPVKVPLWTSTSKVKGKTSVTVKIVGSFMLDTVTSKAEVIGHFVRTTDGGAIGDTPGTLVRVVLVK